MPALGTDSSTPFDELALRWMLFLGAGGSVAGASVAHTVFARQTARSIGWETNGFQFELGYASLAMGLAAIYASTVDEPAAWVVASIASGLFLLLAGFNHVFSGAAASARRPAREPLDHPLADQSFSPVWCGSMAVTSGLLPTTAQG